MRCFSCDKIVSEGYDKKTDRWYCFDCFEPTNRVLLKNLDDEMSELFGPAVPVVDDWVSEDYVEWHESKEQVEDAE